MFLLRTGTPGSRKWPVAPESDIPFVGGILNVVVGKAVSGAGNMFFVLPVSLAAISTVAQEDDCKS